MSEVFHSAGELGATRCSESATGSSDARLQACKLLFAQLAPLLCALREVAHDAVGESSDDAWAQLTSIEAMASLAGALADRGCRVCGGAPIYDGWDGWAASPALREALDRLPAAEGRA